MNVLLLVFCWTMLIGCTTTKIGTYFKKKKMNECVTLAQPGMYACGGKVSAIPAGVPMPKTIDDAFDAKEYYNERELGHYMCLKSRKNCVKNP